MRSGKNGLQWKKRGDKITKRPSENLVNAMVICVADVEVSHTDARHPRFWTRSVKQVKKWGALRPVQQLLGGIV